jgi:hypothetical protein
MPADPAAAVRALRRCRNAMLVIAARVRIGGEVYKRVSALIAAIDALADELTGERDYFFEPGGGATGGERKAMEEKAARERGEKPWES